MGCFISKERTENPLPPSEKYLQAQPELCHGFYGNFPNTLHIYYTGYKKRSKAAYFIFVTENGGQRQPLYAIKFRMGNLDTKSCVRLYSGTDRTSTTLSSSGTDKWNDPYSFISLPAASSAMSISQTERLMHKTGGDQSSFSIQTGERGNGTMNELFCWQGKNMYLARGKDIEPWILVRDGNNAEAGNEIVATWAELEEMDDQGKIGTMYFQGSGATGELGDYWKLVSIAALLNLLYSRYALKKFAEHAAGIVGGLAFGGVGMAF